MRLVGPSHNYHLGRAEADITGWIAYFIEGMATSFEKVHAQAKAEARLGAADGSQLLRALDAKQRKVVTLFERSRDATAKEIAGLLGFQQRPAAALCRRWVAEGFLVVADPSKKARRYRLNEEFEERIAGRI